ncbi:tRNA (adenosine(37)-N6)-dimethylallyltransferase MiaA [Atopobium sp. oral taxon 416]|uniref:tRNA (adenosine(37)-N6)-dimethylallyltransferase MiaA n=1 Tax=Atopobium sp. oral taxon 416 TaxID=712157 RepID=UPI001BA4E197|nr:tRNA (adenosine(37)-N6)-dimethylallyltransferase MiaA [Atopobium sp. oral taxon 416]QUC02131.1 tRNA (adenosine(37)-N6)-dimethylallyltransferase MiaA [Atopobium sp. oral taxon 416]
MKGGKVLAIVGPTASGKSALADKVAAQLHTSEISIDAMQVYRGMDIGTAKTPVAERVCPLLMVDMADIVDNYSVQLFQTQAREYIDKLQADDQLPVLCGGTGLYLDAVIDDMRFPKGQTDSAARKKYEALAEKEDVEALYTLLQERDPDSADIIHPHNIRRVIRALEMLDEGKSYATQHKGLYKRASWYQTQIYGIAMERERLYRRIDTRVDAMFDEGLVKEVKGLMDQGLASALTALQAIGYKEIVSALNGEITLDEARKLIKKNTRHLAKRQLSWFHRDPRVNWLDLDKMTSDEAAEQIIAAVGEW